MTNDNQHFPPYEIYQEWGHHLAAGQEKHGLLDSLGQADQLALLRNCKIQLLDTAY